MGLAPGLSQADVHDILKAGSKASRILTLKQLREKNPSLLKPTKLKDHIRPQRPNRNEKPVMNLVSSKNYIVANAVNNILMAPTVSNEEVKDYLHKSDYGRTPKYIQKIKKDIQAEYDYIQKLKSSEEERTKAKVRLLPEEERVSLVNALKTKWEKVNTDYQATTHMTKLDTMGKIRRKEHFESQLSQIEKDIEKLSKSKHIFVDQER